MRKFLLIILAAAMAFVTACSNSEGSSVDSTPTISSDILQGDDSSASYDKSETANTSSDPISELFEEQSSTEPKPISTNESTNSANTSADTPSSTAAPSSSSALSLTSSTSSTSSSSESSSNTSSTVNSSTTIKLPESSSSASDNSQAPEPPTDKEENDLNITITVNGRAFSATLYDNETARAFEERLPLTLDMSELNGNEKYYYLPESLPRNSSRPSAINAGDIMLYGGDCIVIFYESFSTSYSYTPIGKINDPDGLSATLGSGSVQITFY